MYAFRKEAKKTLVSSGNETNILCGHDLYDPWIKCPLFKFLGWRDIIVPGNQQETSVFEKTFS